MSKPSTVVAHVPHWLKFCYTSELLQANLVDILYLHDNGALIDFSTAELVGLIRALFADSEKRDNAIERIERGVPAQTQ
jgi:centromere/kinetochore protein ZW10